MNWLLAIVVASTGCFSSWVGMQVTGNVRALDEGRREERVPLPGVHERLSVSLPLAPEYAPAAYAPRTSAPAPLPFAVRCRVTQTANDTVYSTGFRYGRRWKIVAAVMFAIEAGIATAVYFAGDRDEPGAQLAIGFFGADALGTAALVFVPRKEVFRRDVDPVVSPIRTDCPVGLVLDVAGETFPVDAAGKISELGETALDDWMRSPTAEPIRLRYHERPIELAIGQNEVCTWNRTRHGDRSRCVDAWSTAPAIAGSIEVPMGSLTQLE